MANLKIAASSRTIATRLYLPSRGGGCALLTTDNDTDGSGVWGLNQPCQAAHCIAETTFNHAKAIGTDCAAVEGRVKISYEFNTLSAGGTDVIADFEDGVDLIRVTGLTPVADELGRLNITDTTYDGQQAVTMSYGNHTIIVPGVTAGDLSEADFLFN